MIQSRNVVVLSESEGTLYLDLVRRLILHDAIWQGLAARDVTLHAVRLLGSLESADEALQGLVSKKLVPIPMGNGSTWRCAVTVAPIRWRDVDVRVGDRRIWPESPETIGRLMGGDGSFDAIPDPVLADLADVVLRLASSKPETVRAVRKIVHELTQLIDGRAGQKLLGAPQTKEPNDSTT